MPYTLSQAAEATGKSKSTLLRAIQNHKISATRDELTQGWLIEPAELHRLYPAIVHDAPNGTEMAHHEMTAAIKELRAQLEAATQRISDKDDTITDLRRRLDAEGEERRRLTAILTDQRAATAPLEAVLTPPPSGPVPKARRWWFGKRESA